MSELNELRLQVYFSRKSRANRKSKKTIFYILRPKRQVSKLRWMHLDLLNVLQSELSLIHVNGIFFSLSCDPELEKKSTAKIKEMEKWDCEIYVERMVSPWSGPVCPVHPCWNELWYWYARDPAHYISCLYIILCSGSSDILPCPVAGHLLYVQ